MSGGGWSCEACGHMRRQVQFNSRARCEEKKKTGKKSQSRHWMSQRRRCRRNRTMTSISGMATPASAMQLSVGGGAPPPAGVGPATSSRIAEPSRHPAPPSLFASTLSLDPGAAILTCRLSQIFHLRPAPDYGSQSPHQTARFMAQSTAHRRLLQEYRALTNNPPEGITAGPVSEDDLLHWEALIQGPEGTPFDGGVFPAELKFPKDYPLAPPKMTFLGEIFHPNGT